MLIAFATKRALYPFSSWLPIAISAPTPISSLVHSSTLVTAGIYLMFRYSYLFYSSICFMKLLLIVGLFTSLYAGINTLFEVDLKKLVALSTLRHLGFIVFSFSVGILSLAFFHLLTHALFKSLLFISLGDVIINLNHSQDFRYLSSGVSYTPFSSFVILTSVLNLLGIPRLSGYYSKDLVLELFVFSNSCLTLLFILYLNVFFTFLYTYKLVYFTFSSTKLIPYQIFHTPRVLHSVCIVVLGGVSIIFAKYFLVYAMNRVIFMCIPFGIKIIPICLNLRFLLYLVLFLKFPSSFKPLTLFVFSRIALLTPFLISVSSFLWYKISFRLVKDFEMGFINNLLHNSLPYLIKVALVFFFNFYKNSVNVFILMW